MLTMSFLPQNVEHVLAAVWEGLCTPIPADLTLSSTPEDPLRTALFHAAPASSSVGPGPLVMAVTETGRAMDLAAGFLKEWVGCGSRRTVSPTIPRHPPEPITRHDSDVVYARWRLACPAPARDDARYRATALVALHLAAADGPLSTQLRYNHAAAYTVKTRAHPELGEGWLSCEVVVRADCAPDVASLFAEELQRLREDPPPWERIVALRSRMLLRIARSLADNRGRCSDAVSGRLYGLEADHHRRIEAGLTSLGRDDVALAAEALDTQRITGFETPVRVRSS